ncbi:hypothetical protein ACVPOY_08780 [Staphylococcus aureus]
MLDITRFFRNWMFFQRVSGILTFIFIGIHLWQTRLQKVPPQVNYDLMHETLQHPGWAIFYIFVLLLLCFHFANGLWSSLVYWGGLNLQNHNEYLHGFSLIVFVRSAILVLLQLLPLCNTSHLTIRSILRG